MHRKGLGTKAYVHNNLMKNCSKLDTRHLETMFTVTIVATKAYVHDNLELVYLSPDYLVSISTLYKHIKLIIQTRGYNMTSTEPNLLISKAFTE